jgi:LPS export ABC transporter protein LptC
MVKKILVACGIFIVIYTALIFAQIFLDGRFNKNVKKKEVVVPETTHKLYSFSFSKYTPNGEKEIEIEGDSANILEKTVSLMNVVAKAYAEETPVTLTADTGNYDKAMNRVHLKKNVVATTENGTRLLTEELQILPSEHVMETDVDAQVKKDNINVQGTGARGDSNLKKVKFKKNVTVIVQDPNDKAQGPTTITCDGPLIVDYDKNIAHFQDNVVALDARGKLAADKMDVYYNRVSKKVSKIVALGSVVIENPDGNKTYSDSVIYLAEEGRIILGGDIEALYNEGDKTNEDILI